MHLVWGIPKDLATWHGQSQKVGNDVFGIRGFSSSVYEVKNDIWAQLKLIN